MWSRVMETPESDFFLQAVAQSFINKTNIMVNTDHFSFLISQSFLVRFLLRQDKNINGFAEHWLTICRKSDSKFQISEEITLDQHIYLAAW